MDNIEKYERNKENLIRNKTSAEQSLQKAQEKYETIKNSDIDKKERRLEIAEKEIARKRNALKIIEDQLKFLRPADEKDIEYRSRQYDEFPKKIAEAVPEDLQLRFHGCPIYTAEQILKVENYLHQ